MKKDISLIIENAVSKAIKQVVNEAFKSNTLRQWFSEHGGVKRLYTEPEYDSLKDKHVSQPGLGDVVDEDILYMQEFNNENDAYSEMHRLKRPNYHRERSEWDMKAYFLVYKANDGKCLLVGLDRGPNNSKSTTTWGGELDKKTGERRMNNGWNWRTRSNRFADIPKDTYFHEGPMNDFGLWNSDSYKNMLKNNQQIKDRLSPEEWEKYQKEKLEHNNSYLRDVHGKTFRKH